MDCDPFMEHDTKQRYQSEIIPFICLFILMAIFTFAIVMKIIDKGEKNMGAKNPEYRPVQDTLRTERKNVPPLPPPAKRNAEELTDKEAADRYRQLIKLLDK